MTPKLFFQALTKFVLGLLLIGLLLFLSMPLVLASLWSFVIMLIYIPIIALRIRNEEQVLERELKGYTEYKQRVRYKVIPFIW
jgi:protein-S-isoprenylcysteine O-methyltransferase Ste14